MDAKTPLSEAHDLSQQLQDRIEVLPNVERAFVHVDYETTHIPVSPPPLFFCWGIIETKMGNRNIGKMYNLEGFFRG